ncbi:nitrate/nitrite transporter [Sporomusa aerivorans]|uniref:MFS transporter n=1 Tax=Sporomusa aerivorans TaxID=204936 RepID=UPI00352AB9A7
MEKSVPYSRFRWVVLAAISITTMCAAMIMIPFGPLMGVIANDLGLDLGTASFSFMGLHALATAGGSFVSPMVLKRFGLFPTFAGSLFVLSVVNASLPWIAHNLEIVAAIRIIEGLATAPIFVGFISVVTIWFPANQRGLASGFQSVGVSLGIMCGVGIAPVLFEKCGTWQVGIAWMSVIFITALLILLAVHFYLETKPPAIMMAAETNDLQPDYYPRQILRTPAFWVGAIVYSMGNWCLQAFNDLTPGYFAVLPPIGVGFGPVIAGKLMMVVMFSGIVSSLLGGILGDKFGNRSIMILGHTLNTIFCTSVLFSLVYNNRLVLLVSLALAGTGTAFTQPQSLAFACKYFPPSVVSKVIGTWVGAGMLVGAGGVIVGSLALHATGNYQLPIIIVGLVGSVGLIAAIALRRLTTKKPVSA